MAAGLVSVRLVVALHSAVGRCGFGLPMLPGSLLILAAVLGWALHLDETTGWVVFAVATTFLAVGTLVKYLVPGRSMKKSGVPKRTLLAGGLLGIVGFFVIPVVGVVVVFVLGVYLAVLQRVGQAQARRTTRAVLTPDGVSILIAFVFAFSA